MKLQPLMQKALGDDWEHLPPALQAHYRAESNVDVGVLTISYPPLMRPYLFLLKLIGALINRAGTSSEAKVHKSMSGMRQYWRREIRFADGELVCFNSEWEHAGGNQLIEYVNPLFGLRMSVRVEEGKLLYEGTHVVFKLGPLRLPIPEWLLLGHTTIVEQAHGDGSFSMDFRLEHPWFGQVYRYTGRFRTQADE